MKPIRLILRQASVAIALLVGGCTEEAAVEALVSTYYGYDGHFHYPGCTVIQNVPNGSLSRFSSRDDAIAAGLVPCGVCKP